MVSLLGMSLNKYMLRELAFTGMKTKAIIGWGWVRRDIMAGVRSGGGERERNKQGDKRIHNSNTESFVQPRPFILGQPSR